MCPSESAEPPFLAIRGTTALTPSAAKRLQGRIAPPQVAPRPSLWLAALELNPVAPGSAPPSDLASAPLSTREFCPALSSTVPCLPLPPATGDLVLGVASRLRTPWRPLASAEPSVEHQDHPHRLHRHSHVALMFVKTTSKENPKSPGGLRPLERLRLT